MQRSAVMFVKQSLRRVNWSEKELLKVDPDTKKKFGVKDHESLSHGDMLEVSSCLSNRTHVLNFYFLIGCPTTYANQKCRGRLSERI